MTRPAPHAVQSHVVLRSYGYLKVSIKREKEGGVVSLTEILHIEAAHQAWSHWVYSDSTYYGSTSESCRVPALLELLSHWSGALGLGFGLK